MVNFWDEQIDKGIALSKARIKHFEKHGIGAEAIKQKKILQQQERHKELRLAKK